MNSILVRHCTSLSRSMEQSVARIRTRCDKKAIHSFRVLVKKFHAVILLIKELEPDMTGTGKEYRKLRKLFKEAGEIRDLQIQSGILKEFNFKEDDSTNLLQNLKTRKEKNRFVEKLKGFNEKKTLEKISKKVKAAAARHNSAELNARILKFSKGNIEEAISRSENHLFHKARVKLKNAHFCLDIIKSKPEANALIVSLDPIEQKIGKWRDCVITYEILEDLCKKKKAAKTRKRHVLQVTDNISREISRLEFQIQKDFRRLKKIIR